jgi:hypothetical protein
VVIIPPQKKIQEQEPHPGVRPWGRTDWEPEN